jgi:hypothetical protein
VEKAGGIFNQLSGLSEPLASNSEHGAGIGWLGSFLSG